MKSRKIFISAIAALTIASAANAQTTTGAIEQLPIRTLSHVVGHDGSGRVGREPVTDFLKPGSTSPVNGNIACWGTSANLIADCGTPGSMTFQNSNAVSITGGSITGIADLAIADGGTGASTAANARTNLGLGTAATQNTGTSGHNLPFLDGTNTWSSTQTVTNTNPTLLLNATASGQGRQIGGLTNGSNRWIIIPGNSVAESGSNVGSDFQINRYSDAGIYVDTPFSITRSTGIVTLSQPLPVGSGGTGGTTQATARSGIGAAASGANSDITSLSGLTAALSVAQGGTGVTSSTGTGSVVLSNNPSLGAITATSVNKIAITAPATSATLTIANGTTLTTTSSTSVGQGQYLGTATNDNATAGNVGEFASNQTTGTSLTSNTGANATSVSLTAGDWDVECVVRFTAAGSTTVSSVQAAVTTTSATYPGYPQATVLNSNFPTGSLQIINSPVTRLSLSSTTTAYCFALSVFGTSTMTADGYIRARRAR